MKILKLLRFLDFSINDIQILHLANKEKQMTSWIWQISEYTTDSAQLGRMKNMFKDCTLDDAVSYEIGKNVTFERNGSFHTLHYENDLLVRAEVTTL